MKAEFLEFRGSHGEVRLFAESVDDLWHLSHLVRPGDLVFATTFRAVETVTDRIRPEKPEKKPVRLGIRVEGVSFHPYANRLRISGVIEHGVDQGSHHTINLDAGTELSVIKTWRQVDMDRIDRAVKATSSGAIHILAVEEGEAELYRIRQYGPELVSTVTQGSSKGADSGGRGILFQRVAELVGELHLMVLGEPLEEFQDALGLERGFHFLLRADWLAQPTWQIRHESLYLLSFRRHTTHVTCCLSLVTERGLPR